MFEGGRGIRKIEIGKVVVQGDWVRIVRDTSLQEGLDLRSKNKPPAVRRIEHGLFTQVIRGQQHALPCIVPKRKSEHAAQFTNDSISPLLVAMDDHFRVAVG